MRLHELTALLGCGDEEEQVYLVQLGLFGEGQFRFAIESAMHLVNLLPAIAAARDEHELHIGMVEQQTDEFTSGESGTFNNSSLYHSM